MSLQAPVQPAAQPLLLVTGATGYIGGRLVRVLRERGAAVRCLARRPDDARPRLAAGVEVVAGDVLDPASLASALAGVDTAWYLVHAMASPHGFAEEERVGARNFARAAAEAGVRRIVYLGGLGGDAGLSPHLASRHAVGRLLRESGVPVLELRASVIIGSGSLSFELVRALVERLPVLITPRWVRQSTQPIAIDDVLEYLVAAADVPMRESAIVEVGGRDRVSYLDLMREYDATGSTIRQTAIFEPRGLAGLLYWYSLFPVHGLIFAGMLRGIGRSALAGAAEPVGGPMASVAR